MLSIFPDLFFLEQLSELVLRLVLGVIFIAHGYPKLFKDFAGTAQFFESYGIKPATFWVIVVGVVEFVGGILLIIGLFTQIAAILLAINMVVAIIKVKFRQGFVNGYEFDLALLAMTIALVFLKPGFFSIDLPF
ncbi:DoxX family protein [Candidatus Giovannonibacteria bacterium]|nr:DoxX family protein [Candidatus Giovannonibacteria bacterium]